MKKQGIWERFAGVQGGTCGASYLHRASGWRVRHCGHPTANRPYSISDTNGGQHYGPNGLGFSKLADAKAALVAMSQPKKG